MTLNLTVDQVLTTTRSVRKRLDITRPVPRQLIEECLEIALQAPNGSNQNVWRWIVVDDPALKTKLAEFYVASMKHFTNASKDYAEQMLKLPGAEKVLDSSMYLPQILAKVPVMVIPLMPGRPEKQHVVMQANMWGSILPAVWSFLLALRERGLGSAWTTVSLLREKESAEMLGIPYDKYTQVGLFPVAYTQGTDFKRAWRKPLTEVLTYNKF
jgi:nitroreductase